MANRSFTRSFYTFHEYPVLIDANFIVDSTNGNGLGQRSLKGEGIHQVYLNTSPAATTTTSVFASGVSIITVANLTNLVVGEVVTDSTTSGNITGGTTITAINTSNNQITLSAPTAGASASAPGDTLSFAMTAALVGNPNPEAGYIYMRISDSYNRYYGGFSGFVSPVSGTPILVTTGVTSGLAYTIVSVGTTTQAQWQKLGLPLGITPNVGASFIATSSTTATGTGVIEVPLSTGAGIDHIEVIGDANQSMKAPGYTNGVKNHAYVVLACYKNGVLTAPANGTAISLATYVSNSSNTVKGE